MINYHKINLLKMNHPVANFVTPRSISQILKYYSGWWTNNWLNLLTINPPL